MVEATDKGAVHIVYTGDYDSVCALVKHCRDHYDGVVAQNSDVDKWEIWYTRS